MKQVIPFYKEIVFKNNIANLTSISLEHKENVLNGEVSGEFIIFGDYKVHNDTTEKEEFKYKLPFTALMPDDVNPDTVTVDIADFRYEQIDNDVLRIDIDFSIEGECLREEEEEIQELDTLDDDVDFQIDEILNIDDKSVSENVVVEERTAEVEEDVVEEREQLIEEPTSVIEVPVAEESSLVADDPVVEEIIPLERDDEVEVLEVEEKHEEKKETMEEYVTYHVHVVSNSDSVESIIKLYNTNLDVLNEYNDIKELKVGDKVIIPDIQDE